MRRQAMLVLAAIAAALVVGVSSPTQAQTLFSTFSNTSGISIVDATAAGAMKATPYPSQITVQGLSGTISDVNVKLNGFSHGFPDDVAVQVVRPDVTSVLLMSDVGGSLPFGASTGVNGINLTLDDEAANSLPNTGHLTTGTNKPTKGTTPDCNAFENPSCLDWVDNPVPNIWPSPAPNLAVSGIQLQSFDGTGPNGTWKLYVIDDTPVEEGTFAGGWSLEITTTDSTDNVAPMVTNTDPVSGVALARNANVAATFSEEVKLSTLTSSTFKLQQYNKKTRKWKTVPATISLSNGNRTATLDPCGATEGTTEQPLAANKKFRGYITTGAEDLAGNPMANKFVWTFKTAAAS